MTRREIAALACKVLALWTFTQLVQFGTQNLLVSAVVIFGEMSDQRTRWREIAFAAVTGVPAIAMLLVGLFFWFRASRIASWMVSDDPTPVTRPDIAQADIMAVAFSAIGVFTLVQVLQKLVGNLMILVNGQEAFPGGWSNRTFQTGFWTSIIGLTLSLWLILSPRGMVRLVLWAWEAVGRRGYEPTDDSPANPPGPPNTPTHDGGPRSPQA